jgi:hypothetical protein
MSEFSEISLTDAAQRLGISWGRAWRLLLTGKLSGAKRDGRWFVSEVSVADVQQLQATLNQTNIRGAGNV